MENFMKALGELQPATLVLLIFAAVLLLLLLVLIVVTIKVLRSNNEDDEDEEESEGDDSGEETKEEPEEEDETTKKINEAVASVEETKAKVEAEKIAKEAEAARKAMEEEERESAKAKVEEIAKSVREGSSEEDSEDASEEDDEEYNEDSEITGKLNTVKIEEELKKAETGDIKPADELHEAAKEIAESDDYDANMDSAFVDTPEVPAGKTLDATEEAIVSEAVKSARNGNKNMAEALAKVRSEAEKTDEAEEEEPKPKKKKKKKPVQAESTIEKPSIGGNKCYWYNKQDVEGLARKEDMYFKCHYFTDPDDAILDLITEMYDCGYVRTEQLQRIAYGITFKSLGMKEILSSDVNLGFNKDIATKEPSEADREEVYAKWCEYVDSFFEIAVIDGSDEVKDYIKKKMYEYGHRDVEELMYSPY